MKDGGIVTELNKIGIIIVDVLLIISSIYICFFIKFDFEIPKYNYDPFILTLPFIILAYLIFFYVYNLNDVLKLSLGETIYSIFLTIISLMITTTFITFFLRGFAYPRAIILFSSVVQFFTLTLWRTIVWKVRRITHGSKDALVIGNASSEYLTSKILRKQRDIYNIKYICDDKSKNILEYLEKVEVVFICNDVDFYTKSRVVDECLTGRKSVYIIPDIYEIVMLNSKLNRADDIPILKVQKLGLTLEQKIAKRILDIVVSLIGLVITSPIMLISAVIIKVTDGGNIFYKQERVTINERVFNVLKFRTMVMNAEKLTGPVLAGEDDPRITKIGKIMRATRIDELPQLLNILKGDMSIVGPRPERPFFVEQFKKEIPDYKYRTIVKAGLTGLAQVLGKYSTTAEDKVRYDILYIKRYSILSDFKLILQTIKILFMKESSSGVKDEIALDRLIDMLNVDVKIDKDNQ